MNGPDDALARLAAAEAIIRAYAREMAAIHHEDTTKAGWPHLAGALRWEYEQRYGVDLSGRLSLSAWTVVMVAHHLAGDCEYADETLLVWALKDATGESFETCEQAVRSATTGGYLSVEHNPDMPWPTSRGLELLHSRDAD